MSVVSTPRATHDDLMRFDGNAELINGKVVPLMPTGARPNRVALRIARSFDDHADSTGRGLAFSDGIGFTVPELTSGRESFSPDAAYFTGPLPADDMRFVAGAPDFAVEVRSDWDYGPAADAAIADKRADYFEAGTRVVWDVDPIAGVVRRYRPGESAPPEFSPGSDADAEPAAPGWRVSVGWLMRSP
jgi:Uma2 family endonuclease